MVKIVADYQYNQTSWNLDLAKIVPALNANYTTVILMINHSKHVIFNMSNKLDTLKSRVTLYTAGHLHTAVPHCSHSRAPIVHTAVPRENNEHGCVYLRCTAVCKLPGCVEGHPWKFSLVGCPPCYFTVSTNAKHVTFHQNPTDCTGLQCHESNALQHWPVSLGSWVCGSLAVVLGFGPGCRPYTNATWHGSSWLAAGRLWVICTMKTKNRIR